MIVILLRATIPRDGCYILIHFNSYKNNLTNLHFFADEGKKVRQDGYQITQ